MQRSSRSGARLLAALIALALTWAPAAAQQQPTAGRAGPDRIVMLCNTADGAPGPWRDTLVLAIVRAFAILNTTRTQVRGDVDCPPTEAEIFCSAGVFEGLGPSAICNPRGLIRLSRATAWYAAQWRRGETYDAFRNARGEKISLLALAFADGRSDVPSPDQLQLFIRPATSLTEADRERRAMFDAILDLTLAAVFGHEAAHMETKPPYCPVTEASSAEASILVIVKRVQLSDELFVHRDMVQGESTADRCATRRVRLVRSIMQGNPRLDPQMIDYATRAAADLVATGLAFGFRDEGGSLQFHDVPGYYYPAFRIALIVGEMRAGLAGPPLCGGAAEVAVQAYQLGFRTTPGKGQIPDELEEMFPQGVIDAWNGGAWSPSVFACSQPTARARE